MNTFILGLLGFYANALRKFRHAKSAQRLLHFPKLRHRPALTKTRQQMYTLTCSPMDRRSENLVSNAFISRCRIADKISRILFKMSYKVFLLNNATIRR